MLELRFERVGPQRRVRKMKSATLKELHYPVEWEDSEK